MKGNTDRCKKAFTLLEAVVAFCLSASFSVVLAGVFAYCLLGPSFVHNKTICVDALATVSETVLDSGDSVSGLRYCRQLTSLSPLAITYISEKGDNVNCGLDEESGVFFRVVNNGERALIPYYALAQGIKFYPVNGRVFRAFDKSEHLTYDPSKARRIELSLSADAPGQSGEFFGAQEQRLLSSITLR